MPAYAKPLADFRITKGGEYGAPRGGKLTHRGTDGVAAIGTHAFAPIGGKVASNPATESLLLGWTLVWLGDDGLYWSFAHLKARPALRVGDRIERGQGVAQTGDTGDVSGPHLHVACGTSAIIGVGSRDPMQYLRAALSPAGISPAPITESDGDMTIRFISTTSGKTYANIPGVGVRYVSEPAHIGLLQRADGQVNTGLMLDGEVAILNAYLTPGSSVEAIVGAVSAATLAAVKAAIAASPIDVDEAAIAALVDAALADNFAAIPDAVGGELADRLKG